MRVLFLTHYELLLGANRSLADLLEGLLSKGVEPMVFMPKDGVFRQKLESLAIQSKIVGFDVDTFVYQGLSRVKGWQRHLKNLLILKELVAKAREFNPNLIYSNSSVILSGARLAHEMGLPHIWHIREYGKQDYNLGYNLGTSQFEFWANKASAIISISKDLKEKRLYHLTPPVLKVYNGVGKRSFFENFVKKIPTGEVVFLMVGIIHPAKGQLDAVQAFKIASALCNNLRLKIVGGISDYVYFEKVRKSASGLNIEFQGYQENPFEAYAQADVFLMCSPHEAMGRVTAEALCCGLPVVGRQGGATTELLTESGLLYRTSEQLAKIMVDLAKNESLRQNLTQKGKDFALQNFTQEVYSSQIYEILRKFYTPVSR